MKLLTVLTIRFATSLFASNSSEVNISEVAQTYQPASVVVNTGNLTLPDGHVLDRDSLLPPSTYVSWPPRGSSLGDIMDMIRSAEGEILDQRYFLGLAECGYFPGVSACALMQELNNPLALVSARIVHSTVDLSSFVSAATPFSTVALQPEYLSVIFVPVQQQDAAASAGASDQAVSQ